MSEPGTICTLNSDCKSTDCCSPLKENVYTTYALNTKICIPLGLDSASPVYCDATCIAAVKTNDKKTVTMNMFNWSGC